MSDHLKNKTRIGSLSRGLTFYFMIQAVGTPHAVTLRQKKPCCGLRISSRNEVGEVGKASSCGDGSYGRE